MTNKPHQLRLDDYEQIIFIGSNSVLFTLYSLLVEKNENDSSIFDKCILIQEPFWLNNIHLKSHKDHKWGQPWKLIPHHNLMSNIQLDDIITWQDYLELRKNIEDKLLEGFIACDESNQIESISIIRDNNPLDDNGQKELKKLNHIKTYRYVPLKSTDRIEITSEKLIIHTTDSIQICYSFQKKTLICDFSSRYATRCFLKGRDQQYNAEEYNVEAYPICELWSRNVNDKNIGRKKVDGKFYGVCCVLGDGESTMWAVHHFPYYKWYIIKNKKQFSIPKATNDADNLLWNRKEVKFKSEHNNVWWITSDSVTVESNEVKFKNENGNVISFRHSYDKVLEPFEFEEKYNYHSPLILGVGYHSSVHIPKTEYFDQISSDKLGMRRHMDEKKRKFWISPDELLRGGVLSSWRYQCDLLGISKDDFEDCFFYDKVRGTDKVRGKIEDNDFWKKVELKTKLCPHPFDWSKSRNDEGTKDQKDEPKMSDRCE